MAFKSDRSFLDKVTMGATGTIQAMRILKEQGHEIVELERYSTCNKIWATKVKRLRVPDLLCLRCGKRMEVRSKSDLKITMSHSPTVRDRQWDYGLRDEDLVLLIACKKDPSGVRWIASDVINAFTVGDLRRTEQRARRGNPKSQSEGAEVDLTWPAYVPPSDLDVTGVTDEFITFATAGGRRQTYNLRKRGFYGYVREGQHIYGGTTIAASVIPQKANLACTSEGFYDFTRDLGSEDRATVYSAVKALGRLPRVDDSVIHRLLGIAGGSSDPLIQLEALASLARLGVPAGWTGLERSLKSDSAEVRMETVLILDELHGPQRTTLLTQVAENLDNDSELRAAAVWGLGHVSDGNPVELLLPFLGDRDPVVAVHAIVSCIPHLTGDNVQLLLESIGQDDRVSAAVVRILSHRKEDERLVQVVVDHILRGADGRKVPWLLYLIGLLGDEVCTPVLEQHGDAGRSLASSVALFWNQHNRNWTNSFEVQDLLDFISQQQIRG